MRDVKEHTAGGESRHRGSRRRVALGAAVALGALAIPSVALAHLERPSYWPDPRPDRSVSPPAGGEVPKARSFKSAVMNRGRGRVRVVCKGRDGRRSMKALNRSIRKARTEGFVIRPSQGRNRLPRKKARSLRRANRRLAQRCNFHTVQKAVEKSGNNDRVVIMPGRYPEGPSRKQPTNDPRCAELTQEDSGGAETPSFEYQATCPNDQNLIYVQGREVGGEPPSPPLDRREGIPDDGPCVRCNLQIEGSGVKPTDVVLDSAEFAEGPNGKLKRGVMAEPGEEVKDVVLRVDRADGFVARNFLVRGASEHGLYVEETDGYLIDRVAWYWNDDYGNLTFTSDHGRYQRCEGFGSGDANIYPGSAPETGEQALKSFYPDAPRINTVVTRCDSYGAALGYSGSMGNAVRIKNNHFWGNGVGITSDTISAGGHPGFPLDSMIIEDNKVYANNLNLWRDENPPVEPTVGVPNGVGIFIAGGNSIQFRNNWIFDNWFRGTMLLAIPDAIVTPEGNVNPGIACPTAPELTTSCNNRYFDNHMGQRPPGFKPPLRLKKFGNRTSILDGGGRLPNGTDFWWDNFSGNVENCWFDNEGPDGTRDSLETDPPLGPAEGTSVPGFLPENCANSVGTGDPTKTAVLIDCSTWSRGNTQDDHPACDWFRDHPRPNTAAARRDQREAKRVAREFERTGEAERLRDRFEELSAFADRP